VIVRVIRDGGWIDDEQVKEGVVGVFWFLDRLHKRNKKENKKNKGKKRKKANTQTRGGFCVKK